MLSVECQASLERGRCIAEGGGEGENTSGERRKVFISKWNVPHDFDVGVIDNVAIKGVHRMH